MKRQIRTNAVAATFDAAKKLDTGPEHVRALSQRSSERFGASIIVRHAVNTDGAVVNAWLHDGAVKSTTFICLCRICSN
jgi:hypothetical protein